MIQSLDQDLNPAHPERDGISTYWVQTARYACFICGFRVTRLIAMAFTFSPNPGHKMALLIGRANYLCLSQTEGGRALLNICQD
jgi:hypothetical protein